MNAQPEEMSEDAYEDLLTELCGTLKVGSLEFDAGRVVRELDPTAFQCGMADAEPEGWRCGECYQWHQEEDDAEACCQPEEVEE